MSTFSTFILIYRRAVANESLPLSGAGKLVFHLRYVANCEFVDYVNDPLG